MPRGKQAGLRKKKRVHVIQESPFPVPFCSSSGGREWTWFYYTGIIEGSAVVIKQSGDIDFLYKMGFFGKGTLSRSQPNFHDRKQRVQMKLMQKHGHIKVIHPVVINKRSYLVHKRYKALAEGRTKEYRNIVHHEEQQQGFLDSSDEEMSEDNSDDSVSDASVDNERLEAFRLLSANQTAQTKVSQASTHAPGTESENLKSPQHISAKLRSHLVSILAQVSLLSNEQITSFLQVPQDAKQLAEKYKRMRASEVNMLRQMLAARFPGRNFKQGEVITLDEDDSGIGNKNVVTEADDAVVISDSDDDVYADEGKIKNVSEANKIGIGRCDRDQEKKAIVKVMNSKKYNSKVLASSSSRKDSSDWASDDSNFWGEVTQSSQQTFSGHVNKDKIVETSIVDVEENANFSSQTCQVSALTVEVNLNDSTEKEVDEMAVKTNALNGTIAESIKAEMSKISDAMNMQDYNHSEAKIDDIGLGKAIPDAVLLSADNSDDLNAENIHDSAEGKKQGDGECSNFECVAEYGSSLYKDNQVQKNSGCENVTDHQQKVNGDGHELDITDFSGSGGLLLNISEENSEGNETSSLNSTDAPRTLESSKENMISHLIGTTTTQNLNENLNTAAVASDVIEDGAAHKIVNPESEQCNTCFSNVGQSPMKCEKVSDGLEHTNLAKQKCDSPSMLITQTESMPSFVQNGSFVESNDNISLKLDDKVTNVVSDNSNDSDDVICIESKSAEPKTLHTFLSQPLKKLSMPIVTKSVTFMSNITEEPTYVSANVGFHSWGPFVHFNFTGDPTHLPTVMSVSTSANESESSSHSGQLKFPDIVYERIYPPVKSLIPNSNSAGAVIKQRHRGLPCLSTAYLKVSKIQETLASKSSSYNERLQKGSHGAAGFRPKASFNPHSDCSVHGLSTQSAASQNIKSASSVGLPSSLSPHHYSLDSPEVNFSHVCSYLKPYQHNQSSDFLNPSFNIEVLNKETDNVETLAQISSLLISISAVLVNIETYYTTSLSSVTSLSNSNQVSHKDKIDDLLSEFHVLLSQFLSCIEISAAAEFYLIKLLLSKCENHSGIPNESLLEVKQNLSAFQIWLLEKRSEYCEQNLETNGCQYGQRSKIIDLTANSSLERNNSPMESSAESDCRTKNEELAKADKQLEIQNIKHSHKTQESDNRKRKFDISDGDADQCEKKLKSHSHFLTSDETEDKHCFNTCRNEHAAQPKDEGTDIVENSNSAVLKRELNSQVDVEKAAESLNVNGSSSDIFHEEAVVENQAVTVSTSCKLQDRLDSKKSDNFPNNSENEESVGKKCSYMSIPSFREMPGCSEELLTVKNRELSEVEMESCTNSAPSVPSQLLGRDSVDENSIKISYSLTHDKQVRYIRDEASSHRGENIEHISDVKSKLDQESNFNDTFKIQSINASSSNISATEITVEELLTNGKNKYDSDYEKIQTHKPCSAFDSSGSHHGNISHGSTETEPIDHAENKDTNKNMLSSVKTVSDNRKACPAIREDNIQNAGSCENIQIFIGSSSEEEEEHLFQGQSSYSDRSAFGDVHPYSIDDESDGDLFVVPNTSDEDDDEENQHDDRKKTVKNQQQKWRSCVKKDPYPTDERLYLMLEEAFFLSFGLGCLGIMDPEMKLLDLTQMWQQFQVLKEQFVPHYVAYHYFRSKGWVPKSGLKFGCDLILYREGPPFYHGSYSVIVITVKDGTLLPVSRSDGISFDHRKLNWISLSGLNRITEHVAKELMLCYVIWPGGLSQEEVLSPECISRFKVKEVVVSRWISSEERENRDGEEEIP